MHLPQVLGMGILYCNKSLITPFDIFTEAQYAPAASSSDTFYESLLLICLLIISAKCTCSHRSAGNLTPRGCFRPWTLPSTMIWNSSKVPQRQRTSPTRPTSLEPRRVASAEDASRVRVYPFRLDQNIVRGPSAISISSSSQKTMAELAS